MRAIPLMSSGTTRNFSNRNMNDMTRECRAKRLNSMKKGLVVVHFFLIIGILFMVFPFFWMVTTAFKSKMETLQVPPLVLPGVKHYFQTIDKDGKPIDVPVEVLKKIPARSEYEVVIHYSSKKGKGLKTTVPQNKIVDRTFLFSNFSKAWNLQPFTMYFLNSLFIASMVTFFQLFSSSLAAYAFAFMRFPFKEVIFMMLLGTMMIPQQALLIPNFVILAKLEWINTYKALIIPWLASVFGIFFLRQFFRQLPRELYEAATIDGCSRFGFFWRILLPLSIPPMTTIGIFTFLGSWNSFLWPLMVTNDATLRTIEVGLSYFNQAEGTEFELLMAASTLCILPLVVLYFLAQKQFISSVASTGMKD